MAVNKKDNTLLIMPPAVIVRDPAQARRAVTVARRLARPVLLRNEPGAQAWLGPAYLLEMMRQAGADHSLIDCGADAGTAMLALRVGWRDLHLSGVPDIVTRIAEMTQAVGGRFHAALPDAFDMGRPGPVDELLERWLLGTVPN